MGMLSLADILLTDAQVLKPLIYRQRGRNLAQGTEAKVRTQNFRKAPRL